MKLALAALALALGALAPEPGTQPLAPQAFAYAGGAPHMRVLSERSDGPVRVREVSIAAPGGRRIHAEIVEPAKAAKRSGGVLFVHWLGDPKTTNFTEFHPDALALAQRGCTALLIDAMWSQPHWFTNGRSPKTDFADSIRQVVELRVALDVLERRPGVDPARIAYVGHDFGAMYGAVLSGVDPRPRWYAFVAGVPTFAEWFLLYPKQPDSPERSAYLARIARLDPPAYLKRSRAEGFLFQYALRDEYVPPARARIFADAAPPPRGTFFYRADHAVRVRAAFVDRLAWLEARLAPNPGTH